MENKQKPNRIIYFDILNVIAIISVIALHCNGIIHGNPNTRAWNSSLIIECICYFAVPLFLMMTGANLMNYRNKYDTKKFFKKRFAKVLIPFIFWSVFMFVWKIYFIKTLQVNSFTDLLNAFFTNREETTYYFVWNIIGIYLTMPLLSLVAKDEYKKTLWFVVIIYFIFNAFIPNILSLIGINYNTSATVLLGGYTIYVILGYLLSTTNIKKKHRYLIYLGAVIGVIYRYITTFVLSKDAGRVIKTTWSYTAWHCILLTIMVFLIIKYMNFDKKLENKKKISNILMKISSCSYGVFLIHQIVMYYEKSIFTINTASWQWRTIGVVTTYIISLIIIYFLKQIPLLKKVVA